MTINDSMLEEEVSRSSTTSAFENCTGIESEESERHMQRALQSDKARSRPNVMGQGILAK